MRRKILTVIGWMLLLCLVGMSALAGGFSDGNVYEDAEGDFNTAMVYLKIGDPDEVAKAPDLFRKAMDKFGKIVPYSQSRELRDYCAGMIAILEADDLQEQGDRDGAMEKIKEAKKSFQLLAGIQFEDSAEIVSYCDARLLLLSGRENEAGEKFQGLSGTLDSDKYYWQLVSGKSREESYARGITRLTKMTAEAAQEAADCFQAAGNYEMAQNYKHYALALKSILLIEDGDTDIDTMLLRLQMIAGDESFSASLAKNRLPSCDQLIAYIEARQYELAGDYYSARNIFLSISGVLDTMDKQIDLVPKMYEQANRLYEQKDYRAAAEIFQELGQMKWKDSAEKYQQVLTDHDHQWIDATCTEPKTCTVFNETEGEPLGHDWTEAICTEPKTCRRCGATEGEPLGHDWQATGCTEPAICSRCGAVGDSALGHDWKEATCTEPKTCKRCGATEGSALGHNWKAATCTEPKTCSRCGKTEGSVSGHNWIAATCIAPRTCSHCGATEGSALGHNWKAATCTEPKTCMHCGATEGEALGHDWREATYTEPKTCNRCGITEGTKETAIHQKGDIVDFGHYEQDNDPANGKEEIAWMVLDYDEKNNKVLLISIYGLDARPYSNVRADITWEKCTLRDWLNNDFYNEAFSEDEKKAILMTEVDNSRSQGYSGWDTTGGINTQDRLFLLSYAEANLYLDVGFGVGNVRARVAPTAYAIARGAWIESYIMNDDDYPIESGEWWLRYYPIESGEWWLRSPGELQDYAALVFYDGALNDNGVSHDSGCVRPAFWLNLDSDISDNLIFFRFLFSD